MTAPAASTVRGAATSAPAAGTAAPAASTASPAASTAAPAAGSAAPAASTAAPAASNAAPAASTAAPEASTASPAAATNAPAASTTAPATVTLARADVDAALADFSKLANSAHGEFTATGLRIDSVLAGSLFAQAGVRAGDLIASVDGQPLRSLDDAASLYARASTARNITLQLVRAGKPLALRLVIR